MISNICINDYKDLKSGDMFIFKGYPYRNRDNDLYTIVRIQSLSLNFDDQVSKNHLRVDYLYEEDYFEFKVYAIRESSSVITHFYLFSELSNNSFMYFRDKNINILLNGS